MKISVYEPNKYYSYLDEENFFKWIESNPAVTAVERQGGRLIISFKSARIAEQDLRDLIAVFARYQISMRDIKKFAAGEHKQWLNNPDAYWYRSIFEGCDG